jgi:hypothetical protein
VGGFAHFDNFEQDRPRHLLVNFIQNPFIEKLVFVTPMNF